MNSNFIAIDFETATSNKMACQIGITIVENGAIKDTIVRLIQPPNNKYDVGCIQVHHITPEQTSKSPTFDIVWEEIKNLFIFLVVLCKIDFVFYKILQNSLFVK